MSNKVIEVFDFTTPLVESSLDQIDFRDTFATQNKKDSLECLAHKIFNQPSVFIKFLFLVRNTLVKLIGLSSSKPKDYNEDYKVGGYVGFFRIYEIKEEEIILGLNDKHLNFRVSIFNDSETKFNIKVTTIVQFNNKAGLFYMNAIKPFHRIVVKAMVKKAFL